MLRIKEDRHPCFSALVKIKQILREVKVLINYRYEWQSLNCNLRLDFKAHTGFLCSISWKDL